MRLVFTIGQPKAEGHKTGGRGSPEHARTSRTTLEALTFRVWNSAFGTTTQLHLLPKFSVSCKRFLPDPREWRLARGKTRPVVVARPGKAYVTMTRRQLPLAGGQNLPRFDRFEVCQGTLLRLARHDCFKLMHFEACSRRSTLFQVIAPTCPCRPATRHGNVSLMHAAARAWARQACQKVSQRQHNQ